MASSARAPRRSAKLALLLSVLVASTSLTVILRPGAAVADQVADLKAQATTLSQQLIEEQLQADAYQQQFSVITAKIAAGAQTIARLNRQIVLDQDLITRKSNTVGHEAIAAYTDYGSQPSGAEGAIFGGNQESVEAASEYSGIAVGNITTAVDQLRTARRTLQAGETALQQQQAIARTDQSREANYLSEAHATEARLEASRSRVTGQLATAIANQAAAQDAAAAAAIAAAQHNGASSSNSGAGSVAAVASSAPASPASPASAGVGGGATSDPALNPFLQCVVQAESGGDYSIVSPNGLYMGAFQFSQSTWNVAAQAAGLPSLVGVPPNLASKADQDTLAVALYAMDGEQPWLGDRCSG
jgi:SWI/SNF-related matrix-associated actin-dependent regulator 1 of chromatin subfamily A